MYGFKASPSPSLPRSCSPSENEVKSFDVAAAETAAKDSVALDEAWAEPGLNQYNFEHGELVKSANLTQYQKLGLGR